MCKYIDFKKGINRKYSVTIFIIFRQGYVDMAIQKCPGLQAEKGGSISFSKKLQEESLFSGLIRTNDFIRFCLQRNAFHVKPQNVCNSAFDPAKYNQDSPLFYNCK